MLPKCRECGLSCKKHDKALKCDACEEWLHIGCSNVEEARYDVMVQLRALSKGADDNPWYCKFCNKKVAEMGKLMGTLTKKVVKLEKDVKEVKEHIEVINQEIVQKCDENKVRELIDNELVKLNIPDKCDEKKVIEIIDKNLGDKNATLPDRSYDASIKELEDRQVRKCNFLIFMAPECDSILKKDVDENNMEITQAVINECGIGATIEGRQVRRIGHKHANARNPRPILVTMNNVYDKHTLFRRFVDKVKKSDNNTVKNLRISHDLTRCQREEEAKLAKEAKRMSNEDARKKYAVRGPSWDRKILELRN